MAFAIRVVNCAKYLQNEQKDFVLSKQILRSGTSIGANVHEGLYAQSRADFVTKYSIALKEASETSYWLVLLKETAYISFDVYESMRKDVDELIRLIIASLKTAKKENDSNK